MSYSLQSIHALPVSVSAGWQTPDTATATLQGLLNQNEKVWLKLTESVEGRTVWLDLARVRAQLPAKFAAVLVTDWLASLGNTALPTLTVPPSFAFHSARYAYAYAAGYRARPVQIGRHPDADTLASERNDLLLTKDGVDFQTNWRYLMVSVNGLFHRVGGSEEGLYVIDGARTGRIGNNNHVGIYSFRDVGSLDYIPLTPDMIYRVSDKTHYADKLRIRLPYSVEQKTVLLVVGGYLHALDTSCQQVGARSLVVHTRKLGLAKRILEARTQIELHNLQLARAEHNPSLLSVPELITDRVVVSYLTLPQSFLVVVNQPTLKVRRHDVESARLPGRYLTPVSYMDQGQLQVRPKLPLIGDLGRLYEYTTKVCDEVAVLETDHQPAHHYRYETGPWRATAAIDDGRQSFWPWSYSRAHLLEIGCYG